MSQAPPITGRFAPAPTGRLHTGSLVAAVGSWLMAKHANGRWLLRMDDLDRPRQVPGMADDILATLEKFGLAWDGEISWQSRNIPAYEQGFEELKRRGVVYPCGCSRKEIAQAASAPHPEDDCLPYPGTCRNGLSPAAVIRSWRVKTANAEVSFDDMRKEHISYSFDQGCGDFVLRRGDGEFAYQLAVVIDDHLTGVNQVVRGDDLLPSTPRQIYLQSLLGFPLPDYCHLPLVTGPCGCKLSKRDNLVSQHLGNLRGRESDLLMAVLRFLGQEPPGELNGAPCEELLRWGVDFFDVTLIPAEGGELVFTRP